jgi:LysR family transcriptional regulator of gallate degradation
MQHKLCVLAMSDPERLETLPAVRATPAIIDRLKALRCLPEVVAHGSALRAAEAIHLSQPAVTRAILELEAFCGMALFERAARGMLPTALGARTAARAEVLFAHLAQGAAEAGALAPRGRRVASPQRFAAAVPPVCLKALLAVSAASSEARAAETLNVSQPAVHRSLRALEDLAGVALFQKSARGTRLTAAGEALLRRVKLAFGEARAMESDIASWRGEIRGRVVVGALPLSVAMILPQAVDAVRREHPDIEITVIDGTYESLIRQLRSADIDAIVGALRSAPDEVRQEALFEDELAVIARAGHPCLARKSLALKDLLRWEWVVPLPGTPASAALERTFAAQGLAPPLGALQANSAAFTRALVRSTDRLALASRGQELEDESIGVLRIVPVRLAGTVRTIGVAVRSTGEPSPDLLVLLDALRDAAARRDSR